VLAESHCCCPEVLDWCRTNGLDYNLSLAPTGLALQKWRAMEVAMSGTKQRRFTDEFKREAVRLIETSGASPLAWRSPKGRPMVTFEQEVRLRRSKGFGHRLIEHSPKRKTMSSEIIHDLSC
jgi:hypothetical protein